MRQHLVTKGRAFNTTHVEPRWGPSHTEIKHTSESRCYDGVRLWLWGTLAADGSIAWIWNNGGMILIRENRRTRRKTFPSTALSTTNPTSTTLGVNPSLHGEKPLTNLLSNGKASLHTLKQIATMWLRNSALQWRSERILFKLALHQRLITVFNICVYEARTA
jgi:hypothetical protein